MVAILAHAVCVVLLGRMFAFCDNFSMLLALANRVGYLVIVSTANGTLKKVSSALLRDGIVSRDIIYAIHLNLVQLSVGYGR